MDFPERALRSARLVAAANSERGEQVSVNSLTVFGIEITTRYSKARELREMIHFVELLAKQSAAYSVTKVFYDSKSCCCEFEFITGFAADRELSATVLACAEAAISQFCWIDGCVYHGADYG